METATHTAPQYELLIVEDDPVLSGSLSSWFKNSGFGVTAISSGQELDPALRKHRVDVVILDLSLPGKDGMELLPVIRQYNPTLPVIITTARDALTHRLQGLNSGADDYVTKPFELAELEARVRAVLRRAGGGGETTVSYGNIVLDLKVGVAKLSGEVVDLTRTEFRVLVTLVEHGSKVCRRENLLALLGTESEPVADNLLDVNIHRLRKKVGDAGVSIKAVRGVGFLLVVPE